MADYDQTYTYDSQGGSDTGWDYSNDVTGAHSVQTENTAANWCWTNTGSTSTGTGPPSGTACIYTETSSPVAASEEFTATLTTAINASTYALFATFNTCTQGNAAATLYFEAYNGSTWDVIDSWTGDATTTFTSRGPYNFSSTGLDYTNSDFKVRFRVVAATSGNVYTSDFAIDTVRIYGDIAASIEQEGFRFYNDGTESGSAARQAQDVNDTIGKATTIQLRTLLNATGDPATKQYQLEYKESSDATTEWRKVPLT